MDDMKIVDARSGKTVTVGRWVLYPPPSPVARWYDGPSGMTPEGYPDLTPDWPDPSRWRLVPNTDRPIVVPGTGPVSKDSFRVVELRDRGDHADVHVETVAGLRGWTRVPIRGVLFWRKAVLPT